MFTLLNGCTVNKALSQLSFQLICSFVPISLYHFH
jgi:hypothetical protein